MAGDKALDGDIYIKYQQVLGDNARLREQNDRMRNDNDLLWEENSRLKELLGRSMTETLSLGVPVRRPVLAGGEATNLNSQEKISLFRSLFRGRDDVYPRLWENKRGGHGYTPACANEWEKSRCGKPRVKCGACGNRKLLPLTDQVVADHLTGKRTIGVYPLLADETCWFLAADFDKAAWRDDCQAFIAACREMGVSAALERSRSGNGGHAWIFFTEPVPASTARQLGSAVLTRAMQLRHQIGLDSYDRFFPNQDTMPKGGFGNLIACPLQRNPRQKGNSVFLDDSLEPYRDQWQFLSTIKKMTPGEVEAIVRQAARVGGIVGVKSAVLDEDGEDQSPWLAPPSKIKKETLVTGPLPEEVRITLGNLVYVEKRGLPSALLNRLQRLAALQNPEFYKTQAMRLPVARKDRIIPRVIACAEDFPGHIGLPRGCLDEVVRLLAAHDIRAKVADERFAGNPIAAAFKGELTSLQAEAAATLTADDNGILLAATAFGKTVVGAWVIAARKVNTLVIVDGTKLMEQWRDKLTTFLDLPTERIGQVGDGKVMPTGVIDVAMIQSLYHKADRTVDDLVGEYGQVIFDECHHVSAFTFEQVLKQAKARYILGLTATLVRKDGLHPIVIMQCGPVRFRQDARQGTAAQPFEHVVFPRITRFMPREMVEPGIQEICSALVTDDGRNGLICYDVLQALHTGRSPLILTQRKEHVDHLAKRLEGVARHVIVLQGGMGKKERRAVAERLAAIPDREERVIVAIGRFIGEGFDDARLDTLFLVGPVSWKGTLQQYAGRLHRLHEDKKVVQIYDYVDAGVPMLYRMYQRMVKEYKAMGYKVGEIEPF
ncbi:MAG: DEAD/DEAH box helicase family protein [Peptococcaceae bacterium]|jgi:superfamily II DNA or RNA helicase|nr:DEAD/DEAH box helicase family protein [Peptococcaceae bacterium]